ncbi:MAG: hypothetical protein ABIC04_01240 [Nanoarchaeota archaeon]
MKKQIETQDEFLAEMSMLEIIKVAFEIEDRMSELGFGNNAFNKFGQALRGPEEFNPHSEGYTPFGDE